MKEIELNGKTGEGKFLIVDDESFWDAMSWQWRLSVHGYAVAHHWYDKKDHRVAAHRLIMGCPKEMQVDHINGNRLDCRKSNLRICTNQQNQWNRRPEGGSSKYKGVWLFKKVKKWTAKIYLNNKNVYIGIFKTEIEAAKAYDKKAKELFGEFARLNFPNEH